jgi:hypothetical protein
MLLLKLSSISLSLAIVFCICYLILYGLYGSLIPFVLYLPFISTYLLCISKKEVLIDWFLAFSLFLTLLELIGLLPLYKMEQIEVGTPNIVIILSLQIISYIIWASMLKFYTLINKMNFLGIDELISNTSKDFIVCTISKGLYISVLFHFFNNFLNSIVWGTRIPNNKIAILKLFADSDRTGDKKVLKLMQLLSLVNIPDLKIETKMSKISLSQSRSRLLYLLLYNINNNYIKYSRGCRVSVILLNKNILKFEFTPYTSPIIPQKSTWSRNLGTMKQLLRITQSGDISIVNSPNFITTLLFDIGDVEDDNTEAPVHINLP